MVKTEGFFMGNSIEEQTITENANGIWQRWLAIKPNGPGVYEGLDRSELLSLSDYCRNGAPDRVSVEIHRDNTALITEGAEDRTYRLDPSGRVVRFEGPTTRFGYNPQHIAEYEYDEIGRLTHIRERVSHPLLDVVTYIGERRYLYPEGAPPVVETTTLYEMVFLDSHSGGVNMEGNRHGS